MHLNARMIVKALGGRWSGKSGMCKCPAHDDRTPSLSVADGSDGIILVRCHAGCTQREVIAALRHRGLWGGSPEIGREPPKGHARRAPEQDDADRIRNRARAQQIWLQAQPIEGTAGESYLRSRGITIDIPASIRFARLPHVETREVMPSVVCAVQGFGSRDVAAVQRIFLTDDPVPTKVSVSPTKATLGPLGDGALRLGNSSSVMGIAEGPETALSAMQMFGITTWCSLGASRMRRVKWPAVVETVHIFSDSGVAGPRAARETMAALTRAGIKGVVRAPAAGDWNDVLQARGAHDGG